MYILGLQLDKSFQRFGPIGASLFKHPWFYLLTILIYLPIFTIYLLTILTILMWKTRSVVAGSAWSLDKKLSWQLIFSIFLWTNHEWRAQLLRWCGWIRWLIVKLVAIDIIIVIFNIIRKIVVNYCLRKKILDHFNANCGHDLYWTETG